MDACSLRVRPKEKRPGGQEPAGPRVASPADQNVIFAANWRLRSVVPQRAHAGFWQHRADRRRGVGRSLKLRCGGLELRVVQEVEGLAAQLEVGAADPRVLDERHVEVELSRPVHDVAAGVAVRAGVVGGTLEGGRVEPLLDGRIVESRSPIMFGRCPVPPGVESMPVCCVTRREGQARAPVADPAQLPAAVPLGLAERQLVHAGEAQGVRDVVVGEAIVVGVDVVDVQHRHQAVVVRVVVLCVGQGVGREQRDAVGEAPLQLGEEAVVVQDAPALHLSRSSAAPARSWRRDAGCSSW